MAYQVRAEEPIVSSDIRRLSILGEKLKKLTYYRDVKLLAKVFLASARVSFGVSVLHCEGLISLGCPKKKQLGNVDREKVIKYVSFCLRIRNKLGFKDTCLTSSVLLSHILRKSGISARMNFGAKKNEKRNMGEMSMTGHCWVTIDEEEIPSNYRLIFKYPSQEAA